MRKLHRWIRQIHRWLVIPFSLAIIYALLNTLLAREAGALPVWLTIIAIGSLLLLLFTGTYLFTQYYWAKWRRARRAR